MTVKRQDTWGSGLVAALEDAWEAIRSEHPDLPTAVLITGAGSLSARRGLRLGHFAAGPWQADQPGAIAEIFVGREGLARGATPVLATLLHEAAHALAHKRQLKDTSRQGRYHNRRFKDLAEQVGLQVEHHPTLGWSPTTLPEHTAVRYTSAIRHARAGADCAPRARARAQRPLCWGARSQNLQPRVCSCARRIRVAAGVLAQAPIICGICQQPFGTA